jgi:hypothetical protein
MIFALPESLQFLFLNRKGLARATRWLKRIDSEASAADAMNYCVLVAKKKGVPWLYLFHEGRSVGTTLL